MNLCRLCIRHLLVNQSQAVSARNTQNLNQFLLNSQQIRHAGHAKWQNIAKTKQANDNLKAKTNSRFVMMIKRAIVMNNMQANPKLNKALADILSEASRSNVPKATLERAINRALNMKLIPINLEIKGPGGCIIIARCETESVNFLRREVKKAIKKFNADLVAEKEDSVLNMFQSQGFVRTAAVTMDGRDVNFDFAEEAAIVANAEDVVLEENEEAEDLDSRKVWVFKTNASYLNGVKGELEKFGMKILSHDLELVPYRLIEFPDEVVDELDEITRTLLELEQVIDVYHNVERQRCQNDAAEE